jgi:DNA-directed RNA polymerase subunit M/transcription elongation factor TFIIS
MPLKRDAAGREVNRIYQNAWYHANKESALRTRKARHQKLDEAVRAFKVGKGCRECGERHPACLEFHHPDPSTKDVNPSDLVRAKGWSLERLMAELQSLHVLCANCHRKVHHGWQLQTGSRSTPPVE